MNPSISVITPCYNHGEFLDDACKSIEREKHGDVFEHIIVNDGSTDHDTLLKLKELESQKYNVIHQKNRGLANARNTGIAAAKGKFILPLDSDNKIVPAVMLKALRILEGNSGLDVVYTDSYFFGEKEMTSKTTGFDILKMLYNNYIDACALIRKEALDRSGGYDENMPVMGHEDWELWINIALNSGKFHYLEETGYFYRIVKNSMVRTITHNKQAETRNYIFKKHTDKIGEYYAKLYEKEARLLEIDSYMQANRFKSIIKLILNRPLYK